MNEERYETALRWEYNHLGTRTAAWQDPRRGGWYFEWIGEHVSKPCRDLIHTDGSVGTDMDGGSPYLPVAPSVPHLIESHALTDSVATWRPWPMAGPSAPSAPAVASRRLGGRARSLMGFFAVAAVGQCRRHGSGCVGSPGHPSPDTRLVSR